MNQNKKVDALGFDRFEIANIRRCAGANKTNYKKIDAIKAKIMEYGKLLDAAEALAETWDAPAKQMSKDKLGIELTAREVIYFHENPEKLYEEYPELAANLEPENAPEAPADIPEGTVSDGDPFNA